ncbi:MAG: hypothetical protein ACYDBQ_11610 [Thermoplasmatota archaeon]
MDGPGEWAPRFSWVGFALVVIGAWWLLGDMGKLPLFESRYVWPILLVGFGCALLAGRARRRRWW